MYIGNCCTSTLNNINCSFVIILPLSSSVLDAFSTLSNIIENCVSIVPKKNENENEKNNEDKDKVKKCVEVKCS